jgi:hypothetical protein
MWLLGNIDADVGELSTDKDDVLANGVVGWRSTPGSRRMPGSPRGRGAGDHGVGKFPGRTRKR